MVEAGAPWQYEFEKMKQRSGYLFTSWQWSDCIFNVGSETNQEVIQAHKLVLAMASPVFEAMFYGGLSERKTISIPDVEPEAFRHLLRYIYTGSINIGSFDMACDLWYGAKKYMLPHLGIYCNNYIWSVLGPRNVCKAYNFANLFDETTLMDICIQIIGTNIKEILNDKSFEDVELNTVITVFSLEHLNVDSELDLFNALVRYAKAGQRVPGQISLVDIEPPSKKRFKDPSTSEQKELLLSAERSSEMSPAEQLDSMAPTEDWNEEEVSIRTALQNIRFLSLSAAQFAEGPARSNLLTDAESLAVLENITSRDSAMPMPTGFSECRERRQLRSDLYMDEGDQVTPSLKLGNVSRAVVDATMLPTPAEIVRGLLSRDRETLEHAARAARNMTCLKTWGSYLIDNVTQLVAAGSIPPLVTALQNPGTGVQYDAAWALTNIAGFPKFTDELVHVGAVPVLVGLLGRGGAVAEQAARALGNIAAGKGCKFRNSVLEAGAGPALLAHMQPSTPSVPLATYLRIYRILCQHNGGRLCSTLRPAFKLLISAVPYIENLLFLADEQVLVEACWVLRHLASGGYLNPQLFTPSLAARLTALLQPAAAPPRVQAAALAAVGNMLDNSELIDLCLEAGFLDHIINFLQCGNPSAVEVAAWGASAILSSRHLHIQQALDKGILKALEPVLTEGSDSCKETAAFAISDLCDNGSESQLHALVESAALQHYCRLLADKGDTCRYALQGLEALLKNSEQNTTDVLLLKLRKIGVPRLLNQIRHVVPENNHNHRCAKNLLETYFPKNQ